MKAKCIKNNNYNITIDKEYDVISRDENYIHILNDNDSVKRYSASFFHIEEEVKYLNIEELKSSLVVKFEESDEYSSIFGNPNHKLKCIRLNVNGQDIEMLRSVNLPFYIKSMGSSCGVYEMCRIVSLIINLKESIEESNIKIKEEEKEGFVNYILLKIIQASMDLSGVNLFVASCNLNNGYFDRLEEIFSCFTNGSIDSINPNSGNDIRVWTIKKMN